MHSADQLWKHQKEKFGPAFYLVYVIACVNRPTCVLATV